MPKRKRIWATGGIVSALLLLAMVAAGAWFVRELRSIFSGDCPPEIARVNATCTRLENESEPRLQCGSTTGTREWAACEQRSSFFLWWAPMPDAGWQSEPFASGWVSEAGESAEGGPWSCSNGQYEVSLNPGSIPAGEEGRAAMAFAKVCARLTDGSYDASSDRR